MVLLDIPSYISSLSFGKKPRISAIKMKYPKPGDRIKVIVHHWCRAHDTGVIVAALSRGKYEILFDKVGVGYNDGTTLIVDIHDFEIIE